MKLKPKNVNVTKLQTLLLSVSLFLHKPFINIFRIDYLKINKYQHKIN